MRTNFYSDWIQLGKLRIQALSTPAALLCCWLADGMRLEWTTGIHLAIGLTLMSFASAVLNQVVEVELDKKMVRTANRPLPAGRVSLEVAQKAGWVSAVLGALWLWFALNPLTAWLGIIMFGLYVFVYTPLKGVTELNTIVGAIPGALPLLVGWAAAGNGLDVFAGTLFAVLFLWQLPHFMAIAWLYREDYARAGMKMLPSADKSGALSARQAAYWALTLLVASLLPTIFGFADRVYFFAALTLGVGFLAAVLHFGIKRTDKRARALLWASLIYLPLLLLALAL
ncbi:MAG: heme o synthase [Planctomycetota bacterium]|jgi:protoheme IX farnesyltransferase|nr:heme o synthase [Planctomycetota bacterium]MDP6941285.1 heme o synthase [Planctomycetota bacterium]